MAQANEFNYLLGKTAFMSAEKYLLLVKRLMEGCNALESGTLDSMMREGGYTEYMESRGSAPEGKSDSRSLIAFLYSLYNGIEQVLLGYYYVGFPHDRLTFVPTYVRLEAKFDEFNLAKDDEVTAIVNKYSHDDKLPALLKGLLFTSEQDALHFKTTRRSLENNDLFRVLDMYTPYYFTPEQGREFFTEVFDDINTLLDRIRPLIDGITDEGLVGERVDALKVD